MTLELTKREIDRLLGLLQAKLAPSAPMLEYHEFCELRDIERKIMKARGL